MYEKDSTASATSWKYVEELWSTDESYTPNPAAKGVHMVECPDFFPIMPNGDVYSQNTGSLEQIYLLKYSLMETRLDYYELGTYQNKRFFQMELMVILIMAPILLIMQVKPFGILESGGV